MYFCIGTLSIKAISNSFALSRPSNTHFKHLT